MKIENWKLPIPFMLLIPQVSEKSGRLNQMDKYAFKVPLDARKVEIRKQLEKTYGVKISSVNIIRLPGKVRKTSRGVSETGAHKKAIVTLAPDSKKFEVTESV